MNRNSVIIAAVVLLLVILFLLFGLRYVRSRSVTVVRPSQEQALATSSSSSARRVRIVQVTVPGTPVPPMAQKPTALQQFEARLMKRGGGASSTSTVNSNAGSSTTNMRATSSSNTIVLPARNSTTKQDGKGSTTTIVPDGKGSSTVSGGVSGKGSFAGSIGSSTTRRSTISTRNGALSTRTGTSGAGGGLLGSFSSDNADNSWSVFYRSGNNVFRGLSSNSTGDGGGYFGNSGCLSIDTQIALCGEDGWRTTAMVQGGCPAVACVIGMNAEN